MIGVKLLNVAIVALLSPCLVLAQYGIYEHGEEDDNDDARSPVDYSKYFGGVGGPPGPDPSTQALDGSPGFVQPLDFTGFFAGGHFGLDGLAGGASQQVFRMPEGVNLALPVSGDSFILRPEQDQTNNSGFVNGMNFKSMFDTTTSSSEHGFRPKDFLPRSAPGHRNGFYSPGFDSLQRDVDREVDYQKREETAIEQSRQTNSRRPVEEEGEDDLDEYDSSEISYEDPPQLDPNDRSPQQYTKQNYEEREDKFGNSNTKRVSYNTPHSRVNHYQHNTPPNTRQFKNTYKKPVSNPYESDEEYFSPSHNSDDKAHPSDASSSHGSFRTQNLRNNLPSKNVHRTSPTRYKSKYNKNNRMHPSQDSVNYQGSGQIHNTFSSGRPNHLTKTHSLNSHSNKTPLDFRPSPRDPYQDSIRKVHNEQSYRPSVAQRNPLPRQREFNSGNRHLVQPITAASENKVCHRINKKIDPKEFARFKRQQMTCYICKNKETGNTYEECSYESDPKGTSFYKGSAEAYSSDELLSPTVFQIRERRSSNYPFEIRALPTVFPKTSLRRQRRQYDYNNDEVKGHGIENYRFGPEYFQNGKVNKRKPSIRNPRRYDDDSDEYEEESGEESDIEKEYQPPGASEDDDCRKVNKDGLICMVCTNSKSGGSYEQCSYASDPETNRYEYAKQSTYGSKRRPERYKRYTEREQKLNLEREVKPHRQRQRGSLRGNNNAYDNNYKNNKLKRKKVYSKEFHNKAARKQKNNRKSFRAIKGTEMPGVVGLDPFFYGSPGKTYNPDEYDERGERVVSVNNDSEDDEAEASTIDDESEEAVPSYEETFFRLFPELEGTDPYTGESLSKNRQGTIVNDKDNRTNLAYINDEEESESKLRSKKVKPDNPYGVDLPSYYFDDDESKKDLKKALDDFVQKNRSHCNKVMKEEMTCYQCINKKGLQHEECMFVAESEPQGKHLAYHEVKEFRLTPKDNKTNQSTRVLDENKYLSDGVSDSLLNVPEITQSYHTIQPNTINKTHIKAQNLPNRVLKKRSKVNLLPKVTEPNHEVALLKAINSDSQPAFVNDILRLNPKETLIEKIDHNTSKNMPRNKSAGRERKPLDSPIAEESRSRVVRTLKDHETLNINRNSEDEEEDKGQEDDRYEQEDKPTQTEEHSKGRSNYNSVPPEPENFDEREGPEGAYSHDTEPVYDSRLKITLPKYMLTRSEHEEIFDEVLRSG